MKVVFDTNVLLDIVLNRPERDSALALLLAAAKGEVIGIVTANSITDFYYISRKGIGDTGAREAVFDILSICDVAAVDGDVCSMALNLPISDYEDAVLAICAEMAGADYIASRDEAFLQATESPVPVIRPGAVLDLIADSSEE